MGDVAGEVEPIAVARAAQVLLQAIPFGANRIFCPAADAFPRSVAQRDGAAARPVARQSCKRPRFGTSAGSQQRDRDRYAKSLNAGSFRRGRAE